MTPEDLKEKYNKLYEDYEKIFPDFINKKSRELRKNPTINDLPNTKITDFTVLITNIWKISNRDYQERFWVRQELPMRGDNFMETTMTFNQDLKGILEAKEAGRVKIVKKQYEMLKNLYDMIDKFEADPDTPPDPGYGENDEEIVNDPRWDKIRNYAKEVYSELIKEA